MGTLYSAPSADLRKDLEDWHDTPALNYANMVVRGDFSAHNVAWGYSRADNRGVILVEHMQAKGLAVCNEIGSVPTYHAQGGIGTWPDVTFSSARSLISGWKVEDEITLSDHRYITFRIGEEIVKSTSMRFKTNSQNIALFERRLRRKRGALSHLFRNLESQEELEALLEELYSTVLRIAAIAFRKNPLAANIKHIGGPHS